MRIVTCSPVQYIKPLVINIILTGTETASETTDSDTTVSSTSSLQNKLTFYSRFYGTASYLVNSKISQSLYNHSPSPKSLLGAGNVDPFLTLPVKEQDPDIHDLMNLCK